MTDEEKKAIELLKSYENKLVYEISKKDKIAIKTILNLIEKLNNIIKGKECVIETQAHNEQVLSEALEKKDKIIESQKYIIQEKDTEISDLKDSKCLVKRYFKLKDENKRKDKIIDRMAEFITSLKLAYFKKEVGGELLGKYRCYTKAEWKQYFEKEEV